MISFIHLFVVMLRGISLHHPDWSATSAWSTSLRLDDLRWYCWWLKSCTTWDVWNPINNGIFTISTGAGFQPSTVGQRGWDWKVGKIFWRLPFDGSIHEGVGIPVQSVAKWFDNVSRVDIYLARTTRFSPKAQYHVSHSKNIQFAHKAHLPKPSLDSQSWYTPGKSPECKGESFEPNLRFFVPC